MKFKEFRWVIIITFFVLSIFNVWFGLLGFICMGLPIFQALRGKGKIHCRSHCPRGSFFSEIISKISLRKSLPKFMLSNGFRNGVLVLMGIMLTISMIHSGGDPKKIAFSVFRLMGMSFLVGIIMGIFYKPKSWCAICPMGHGTNLIDKALYKKVKKVPVNKQDKKSA